jgi:hypothetical protein
MMKMLDAHAHKNIHNLAYYDIEEDGQCYDEKNDLYKLLSQRFYGIPEVIMESVEIENLK